ncbi:MAG: hypothetical protein ACD_60C00114G0003 [uncultured bacterium]|nr:MAG: hypothetical protein ACD_60C00114G0003 [uncultured bacterium]
MKDLQSIRREYGDHELQEKTMSSDPFQQFETWLKEALEIKSLDPTAMVLSTVDHDGMPDSRVVLLKEFNHDGFIFYTHYKSPKALQAENKIVALNFHWLELARQIRMRGSIIRISREKSETYFLSRPRESQIAACASKQSAVIASRAELESRMQKIAKQYEGKQVPCPTDWGGYRVIPFEFEFFQGRDNRMNDRIRYLKQNDHWKMDRLSP